jgi:predicted transposase/invertase (TIGR01784 family)
MMGKRIQNLHDLFLKATLSSPQAIQDFFQAYFPIQLRKYVDFSSIRLARESHILPSLKQLENDLIFTCQIGGNLAILLVEHQSTADWRMPLRFLKYDAAILDEYMKDKPAGTPWPLILNFCIYHDTLNKPYPYATNSYDCFPNAHLAQEMDILVRFNLLNLSTSQDASLESHGTFSLLEKLFKYRKEKDLFQIAEYELERCRDWILGSNMPVIPLGADYWQSIFYYLSNVLDPDHVSEEDLVSLFEDKLFINKEDIMRTIAQQIEKRGEEKKAMEVAKIMLTKGLATDFIQEVTKLPKQALDQLRKK